MSTQSKRVSRNSTDQTSPLPPSLPPPAANNSSKRAVVRDDDDEDDDAPIAQRVSSSAEVTPSASPALAPQSVPSLEDQQMDAELVMHQQQTVASHNATPPAADDYTVDELAQYLRQYDTDLWEIFQCYLPNDTGSPMSLAPQLNARISFELFHLFCSDYTLVAPDSGEDAEAQEQFYPLQKDYIINLFQQHTLSMIGELAFDEFLALLLEMALHLHQILLDGLPNNLKYLKQVNVKEQIDDMLRGLGIEIKAIRRASRQEIGWEQQEQQDVEEDEQLQQSIDDAAAQVEYTDQDQHAYDHLPEQQSSTEQQYENPLNDSYSGEQRDDDGHSEAQNNAQVPAATDYDEQPDQPHEQSQDVPYSGAQVEEHHQQHQQQQQQEEAQEEKQEEIVQGDIQMDESVQPEEQVAAEPTESIPAKIPTPIQPQSITKSPSPNSSTNNKSTKHKAKTKSQSNTSYTKTRTKSKADATPKVEAKPEPIKAKPTKSKSKTKPTATAAAIAAAAALNPPLSPAILPSVTPGSSQLSPTPLSRKQQQPISTGKQARGASLPTSPSPEAVDGEEGEEGEGDGENVQNAVEQQEQQQHEQAQEQVEEQQTDEQVVEQLPAEPDDQQQEQQQYVQAETVEPDADHAEPEVEADADADAEVEADDAGVDADVEPSASSPASQSTSPLRSMLLAPQIRNGVQLVDQLERQLQAVQNTPIKGKMGVLSPLSPMPSRPPAPTPSAKAGAAKPKQIGSSLLGTPPRLAPIVSAPAASSSIAAPNTTALSPPQRASRPPPRPLLIGYSYGQGDIIGEIEEIEEQNNHAQRFYAPPISPVSRNKPPKGVIQLLDFPSAPILPPQAQAQLLAHAVVPIVPKQKTGGAGNKPNAAAAAAAAANVAAAVAAAAAANNKQIIRLVPLSAPAPQPIPIPSKRNKAGKQRAMSIEAQLERDLLAIDERLEQHQRQAEEAQIAKAKEAAKRAIRNGKSKPKPKQTGTGPGVAEQIQLQQQQHNNMRGGGGGKKQQQHHHHDAYNGAQQQQYALAPLDRDRSRQQHPPAPASQHKLSSQIKTHAQPMHHPGAIAAGIYAADERGVRDRENKAAHAIGVSGTRRRAPRQSRRPAAVGLRSSAAQGQQQIQQQQQQRQQQGLISAPSAAHLHPPTMPPYYPPPPPHDYYPSSQRSMGMPGPYDAPYGSYAPPSGDSSRWYPPPMPPPPPPPPAHLASGWPAYAPLQYAPGSYNHHASVPAQAPAPTFDTHVWGSHNGHPPPPPAASFPPPNSHLSPPPPFSTNHSHSHVHPHSSLSHIGAPLNHHPQHTSISVASSAAIVPAGAGVANHGVIHTAGPNLSSHPTGSMASAYTSKYQPTQLSQHVHAYKPFA